MTEKVAIQILRGADTIGGSCIKISKGDDYILLDYGMPLMAAGGAELNQEDVKQPSLTNKILLDVQQKNSKLPLAAIISHAHPDHYGLVDYLAGEISVFMSDSSHRQIEVFNIFHPTSSKINRLENCQTYKPWQPFEIGPFKITAFLMDHSGFGACSLLVEVAGKSIFYTGDFRLHGRKQNTLDYLQGKVIQPDIMLMEGTTLDTRHPTTFPTEAAVEDALVAEFNQEGAILVAASGSNIDRLVSLYRACKRTNRILVIDLYQAYLLAQLKEFAPGLPPHKQDHLRIRYIKAHRDALVAAKGEKAVFELGSWVIKAEQLDFTAKNYVYRFSNSVLKRLIPSFVEANQAPRLIYSMWQGYKEKETSFAEIEESTGNTWQYIHTSGHAYAEDLKKLVEQIQPKKLIPIHTLNATNFSKLFAKVHLLENNQILQLDN